MRDVINQEILKNYIDHLTHMSALVDPTGIILLINKVCLDFIGLKEDSEIVGRYMWDTPWWSHNERIRYRLKQCVQDAAEGKSISFETTLSHGPSKTYRKFSVKPLYAKDGSINFLLMESIDITEEKLLKKTLASREKALKRMIENSNDAMLILKNGRITKMNDSAKALFHLYDETLLNVISIVDLSPKFQPDGSISSDKAHYFMKESTSQGIIIFDWIHKKTTGEEFPTEIVLTAMPYAKNFEHYAVIKDRSAQISQINEIENFRLIEQQKLSQIENLVACMTHDIGSAVGNSIMAVTYLVREIEDLTEKMASGTLSRRKFNDYMDDLHDSGKSIYDSMDMISNQLKSFKDLSVDQAKGGMKYIHVMAYIQTIVNTFTGPLKLGKHKVTLTGDNDLIIQCYPGDLAHVISNLISNALTHGFNKKNGGSISIHVENYLDGKILITFEDNGNGIDEEIIDEIFKPFFTTRTTPSSTGLGLHIINQMITTKLKGTLSVESEKNAFTRFTIVLPTDL